MMSPSPSHRETWLSDSMEPAIDFGDEIHVTPTCERINQDGMYMFHLVNANIQPISARKICSPVVKVIWHVSRLADGMLALQCANPSYRDMNAMVRDCDLMRLWRIAGRVHVVRRLGRGFRIATHAAKSQTHPSLTHAGIRP